MYKYPLAEKKIMKYTLYLTVPTTASQFLKLHLLKHILLVI